MSKYFVKELYENTAMFNRIGGNISREPTIENLISQFKVLESEVKELKDGLDNKDYVEILDGAIDITVVIFGLIQLLEKMNFDVEKAMERVALNNLSKFVSDIQDAIKSRDKYLREGKIVVIEYDSIHNLYVLKNADGKIMKPHDFVPVELSDLVPSKYKGE